MSASPEDGHRRPTLDQALETALSIPSSAVHAYVDRLRRRHPDADPAVLIQMLERRYLLAVGTSGGAVGAAAAIPAFGTGAALALTSSQIAAFLAASSGLALAIADVHGIAVDDLPRRRALVMAALLGPKGGALLEKEAGISAIAWGKVLLTRLPMATVRSVNKTLRGRVMAGAAAKAGTVMIGRLLPFGVGAAIGYTGGRVLGRTMVQGVRSAFGDPPLVFTREVTAEFIIHDRASADSGPGTAP